MINILGLSIGIACCMLIVLFVMQEWSYDSYYQNADRLFRVVTETKSPDGEDRIGANQSMPLVPAMIAEFPDIALATRWSWSQGIVSHENKVFSEYLTFADRAAPLMFDMHFLAGNPEHALTEPDNIVITKKMANKYFGRDDASGSRLTIAMSNKTRDFVVSGVVEEMPSNSSLSFHFLLPFVMHPMYDLLSQNWYRRDYSNSVFVQLGKDFTPTGLESKMAPFISKYLGNVIKAEEDRGLLGHDPHVYQIMLQPLKDVHLNTRVHPTQEPVSDPTKSYVLAGLAFLVLAIACINFTILTIGRATTRTKEVGIRKTLGGTRVQLFQQFLGESVFLCFFSLLVAIIFVELSLPIFNRLAAKELTLDFRTSKLFFLYLPELLVFVGVLAGGYPALFLSRLTPVEILKGKFRIRVGNMLTRCLVVLQFGIAIALIVGSLVVSRQLQYVMTRNLGYDPHAVLEIPFTGVPLDKRDQITELLRTRLAAIPQVMSVSGESGTFNMSVGRQGEKKEISFCRADQEYIKTMGIQLLEGRNFDPGHVSDLEDAAIVNESFLETMGWNGSALDRRFPRWYDDKLSRDFQVIGVVRDFHFRSMHEEIKPLALFLGPIWPKSDIIVRIAPAKMQETIELLKNIWNEVVPNTPFEALFVDDRIKRQYQDDQRWQTIVLYASVLATMVACFGLFGVATLTGEERGKEVGIRKVLGASMPEIARLLTKELAVLVVLANLVAWPIAYYVLHEWLQNFAYRISIGIWTFVLAGLVSFVIASLAVCLQVIRAAMTNPVEALRYE
ncbi:MAG: ABC transporter permease [Bacteroidota bacterium]